MKKKILKINGTSKLAKEFKEYIERNISSKLTLSKLANCKLYRSINNQSTMLT